MKSQGDDSWKFGFYEFSLIVANFCSLMCFFVGETELLFWIAFICWDFVLYNRLKMYDEPQRVLIVISLSLFIAGILLALFVGKKFALILMMSAYVSTGLD